MENIKNVGIVIPSLSPDARLVQLVEELAANGFVRVLVINDGSSDEYNSFFDKTRELGAVVLRHVVNQGKGRALKTAFHYVLDQWPDCAGVITTDSDGQHAPEDIRACAESLIQNPDKLILGCRDFKKANVPFKSRYGNVITSNVMKLFVGLNISDTQTGLRGIPKRLMKRFLAVSGERFEYETNMLLCCKEEDIPIMEVPIATIYYENNKSTHFRPLQDSVKIYGLFLKFIMASLSSSLIDIVLFALGTAVLKDVMPGYYIIVSTVLARVISSVYNFAINRQTVFKSEASVRHTLFRYYMLAIVQMSLSAFGVWCVFELFGGSETLIKIVVDCLLFVISFQIQREWVFKRKLGKPQENDRNDFI